MARFSSNTASSQQCIPGPSKSSKRTKAASNASIDRYSKRQRAFGRNGDKQADALEAMKKDQKIKQIKRGRPRIFAHVYIGNLESTITEERLNQHFSACGRIRRTTLRVSRGQAITVGIPIPASARTTRDRKYATMEFYDAKSALNALRLNSSTLDGSKLVVSAAAGDLPEVADIARPHLQNIHLRNQQHARPQPRGRASKAPTTLARNDTERDFSDPKNDKLRLFGFSFEKCIL